MRKCAVAKNSAYLSPDLRRGLARVLAHRGLATDDQGETTDENTIAAFRAAVDAGADYVESDIQVTADGVPVLFHDDDLARIAADPRKIADLSWAELSQIVLPHGQRIPSLEQAFTELPGVHFNLDFKVAGAISPAAEIINRLGVADRILATSFAERRRKRAVSLIDGAVAESAGSIRVIALYLAFVLKLRPWFNWLAKPVECLQIPVHAAGMTFGSASFIDWAHRAGLECHFWTINEPDQMRELLLLGADGLVTDRAELARKVVDSLS